jgi:hypothetical protein
MSAYVTMALMAMIVGVVISNPRLYEKNLMTFFLISCAWVLQEAQSMVAVRSLILALLQGEACHRALSNLNFSSSNVLWITIFALLQENLVGLARLVTALALVSYLFSSVWNRTLIEAVQARSQNEYWSVGDETPSADRGRQFGRIAANGFRRRDWGTILQLTVTRRAYDMLSRRSRSNPELEEAKRTFLAGGVADIEARDRFTMAVFSAISKQGTATVIRSAEASQVGRIATRAAAFVERKFTSTALNRLETLFRPMPFLDPAGQSLWRNVTMLLTVLVIHKKSFQAIKHEFYGGRQTPMLMFLLKQTSRGFLVLYLIIRYVLGYLRQLDPVTSRHGVVPSASALLTSPPTGNPPGTHPFQPPLRLTIRQEEEEATETDSETSEQEVREQ